jgi:pilus assembly protein CpaC
MMTSTSFLMTQRLPRNSRQAWLWRWMRRSAGVCLAGLACTPLWAQEALLPLPQPVAKLQEPATPPTPSNQGNQQPNRLPGMPTPVPGQEQPRVPADPFGNRPRLPALGVPQPLGRTPSPSPQVLQQQKEFIGDIVDPNNTLDLVIGRPRVIPLVGGRVPINIQIGDATVLEVTPINPREKEPTKPTLKPSELLVLGKRVGTTVLNLWFEDPRDANKTILLSYLVRVIPDPEAKERLERAYKALEQEINRNFPDSVVTLCLVGDKLVVTGQAKDIAEATQIMRIVRSNAPRNNDESAARNIPVRDVNLNLNLDNLGPDGLPPNALEDFLLTGGPNVINMLRIPGEQQVQLRVTVAEVDRTAARSIGLNFTLENASGIFFTQTTGGILGSGNANMTARIGNGTNRANLAINALRTLDYARILAEPTLVAINGRPASFQAGGQFPVPVVTGATNTGLQGVSFVPFGVQLSFTPFVTDKDRIRLNVSGEVSSTTGNTPGQAQSANIGGTGGTTVPGLTTRNFQTTVEMREGQTLAIAGLIQNTVRATATRVPYFGDLPYAGRLFAFDQITTTETELVVLVTPELVHPLEGKEMTPLPGSDIFEPGDIEFYLRGILESRRTMDYRSTVRTDIDRMRAYRRCEQTYIVGPHGCSTCPQP